MKKLVISSFALFLIISMTDQLNAQKVGVNTTTPEAELDIRPISAGGEGEIHVGSFDNSFFLRMFSNQKTDLNPGFWWEPGQSLKFNLGDPGSSNTTEFVRFDGKTIGIYNTGQSIFIGVGAGENDDLSNNSNLAIGRLALQANVDGVSNVAIGNNVLSSNMGGVDNTGIGLNALLRNETGNFNVALGHSALLNNVSGSQNTIIGVHAGQGAADQSYSGNVFIGYDSGKNESNDNRLYIDNTATSNPLIYGEFDNNKLKVNGDTEVTGRIGIGTSNTPNQKLEVNGKVKIGNDGLAASAGTMRWNSMTSDFEGYTGTEWVSLTGRAGPWGSQFLVNAETSQLALVNNPGIDNLGSSISVGGTLMVVGNSRYVPANIDNTQGDGGVGEIGIYRNTNGTWNLIQTITSPDTELNNGFGYTVETNGSRVIVGAPGYDAGSNFEDQGKVYVYNTLFGFSWTLEDEIVTANAVEDQFFGSSLNLFGNDLIIGGPGKTSIFGNSQIFCTAYMYRVSGSNWVEQASFTSANPTLGDRFGASVGIEGDYAIVGAPYQSNGGKAFVFERTGSNWARVETLDPPNTSSGDPFGGSDRFGQSVVIEGTDLLVGAPLYNVSSNTDQGQVFGYEKVGSNWNEIFTLTQGDGEGNDKFGTYIKSFQNQMVVSSERSNNFRLYVYEKSGSNYSLESTLLNSAGQPLKSIDLSFFQICATSETSLGFNPSIFIYEQ